MEIPINDKWKLKTEPLCVVLCKSHTFKSGKHKGETIWEADSYYNDIRQALVRLLDLDIQDSIGGVKKICKKLDDLEKSIDSIPFEEVYVYDRCSYSKKPLSGFRMVA